MAIGFSLGKGGDEPHLELVEKLAFILQCGKTCGGDEASVVEISGKKRLGLARGLCGLRFKEGRRTICRRRSRLVFSHLETGGSS